MVLVTAAPTSITAIATAAMAGITPTEAGATASGAHGKGASEKTDDTASDHAGGRYQERSTKRPIVEIRAADQDTHEQAQAQPSPKAIGLEATKYCVARRFDLGVNVH